MITEYIDAWMEKKDDFENWLRNDVNANDVSYEDILVGIIKTVINPYILECDNMGDWDTLDLKRLTIIDDGDYQGTTLYFIPLDRYQPSPDEYIWTHNYYGSCSG